MEDKDKIIASLRKQLKEAVSRCNALEQENALLSYQLEKMEERMSGITLKIDKGQSSAFSEIMGLLQSFPGLKECKKHYSVKLTEEEVFRFRNELDQIMQLLPQLREKEWFDIPAYGTDEWANWMIDLHRKNM